MLQKLVLDCVLVMLRSIRFFFFVLLQRSEEAVTFATGYLTIFLSYITNIQLMREFLCYLTVGRCDGKSVLNYLVQNIATTNAKVHVYTCRTFARQSLQHSE